MRISSGSDKKTDCICNRGSEGPNGGPCDACVTGSYKAGAGTATACVTCEEGTYSNSTSSTMCFACAAFSFSLAGSIGDSDCKCLEGYSGPEGGPCFNCYAGTFKDVLGSAECVPCVVGSYSDVPGASSCTQCPLASVSLPGQILP